MNVDQFSKRSFLILVQISYLMVTSVYVWLFYGSFPFLPISVFTLVLSLWHPLGRKFVKDFIPFLFLVYAFRIWLRPQPDLEHASIQISSLIVTERWLFANHLPGAVLQNLISQDRFWYELLRLISDGFYISHYIIFFLVAVLLWHLHPSRYWQYLWGLLLMTQAALWTMALVPAAPPWWATHFRYLNGNDSITNISQISADLLLLQFNPVGALPSIHAAYAVYIALFCQYTWGKRVFWVWLLPLGVGFAIVFLGHHYVVDFLAGGAYALAAVMITHWTYPYQRYVGQQISTWKARLADHGPKIVMPKKV